MNLNWSLFYDQLLQERTDNKNIPLEYYFLLWQCSFLMKTSFWSSQVSGLKSNCFSVTIGKKLWRILSLLGDESFRLFKNFIVWIWSSWRGELKCYYIYPCQIFIFCNSEAVQRLRIHAVRDVQWCAEMCCKAKVESRGLYMWKRSRWIRSWTLTCQSGILPKSTKANVTQSKLTGILNTRERRQPAVCSALISCLLESTSVLNYHILKVMQKIWKTESKHCRTFKNVAYKEMLNELGSLNTQRERLWQNRFTILYCLKYWSDNHVS